MPIRVFVSHAGRDLPWAEWVTAQLRAKEYDVELAAWDWEAGTNYVLQTQEAIQRADRIVLLLSSAYFDVSLSSFVEWTAIIASRGDRVVPLLVGGVDLPPYFRPLLVPSLYGLPPERTLETLLAAVDGGPPTRTPSIPPGLPPGATASADAQRLPGALPERWNLPIESLVFKGRDGDLVDLRNQLRRSHRAAIWGIGGVGKTALAIHYAHQFASEYDLAWWIDAEQTALIVEQLAMLAITVGVANVHSDTPAAAAAARRYLQATDRWLLVFDNVEQAADIVRWVPEGRGHVLITSRSASWGGVATPMQVGVLTRGESATLLRSLHAELSEPDAFRLAAAVEDLPLALAQAGSVLAETRMPVDEYLQAMRERALELGRANGYERSLGATVVLAAQRLAERDRAARQLLDLCAFMASDVIPLDMFAAAPPGVLPDPLDEKRRAVGALPLAAGEIARFGLGTLVAVEGRPGIVVHRMTQLVLQNQLSDSAGQARTQVEKVLAAAAPAGTDEPSTWPSWAVLVPHLLALDPQTVSSAELRAVVCRMIRYLVVRGDVNPVLPIAEGVHAAWATASGPDEPAVLAAANRLANTFASLGRHLDARSLSEDTLERCSRVLGERHRETLRAMNGLAGAWRALGQADNARDLYETTLRRQRDTLGVDDPETLRTANGLAHALRSVGRVEQARLMFEDTLARCTRALGADHPETLRSASSLGYTLYGLGLAGPARQICADALAGCRRLLGDNHPETLRAANSLGFALKGSGELTLAREVCEDAYTRAIRIWGPQHPEALALANNLAHALRELGRLEAARRLCEGTVERSRTTLGDDHPETLRSTNNLAGVLRELGQFGESWRLHEETLTRRIRVLGEDHPETLRSRNSVAAALLSVNETDRALAIATDANARCRRVLGPDHPETLRASSVLANALRAVGRTSEARTLAEVTYERAERLFGPDYPDTIRAACEYVDALIVANEIPEARLLAATTLSRSRLALGDDHPETRRAQDVNLALAR